MIYPIPNIAATLSSRANASGARAGVTWGERSFTTLCMADRCSRNRRILRMVRRIFRVLPRDCANTIAATISAADSSEIVRSGSRLGSGGTVELLMWNPTVAPYGSAYNPPARTVSCVRGISVSTVAVDFHQTMKKAAPLQDRSLCCLQVFGRAPFKGAGNLVRLPEGFGAATPSRLRKPVASPVDHLPCREIHGDDLGHVVVSKSARPVRPVSVIHQ
jgi:hypothetical protein